MRIVPAAITLMFAAVSLAAGSLGPAVRTAPLNFAEVSAPPRRTPSVSVELPSREALSWTKTDANQVGYVRALPTAIEVREGRWSGTVHAAGAARLRLQLANVNLPANARVWVYSPQETRAVDLALRDASGSLWTPSVAGDTITLEIDAPSASLVVQSAAIMPVVPAVTTCFVDGSCYDEDDFPGMSLARKAVAKIRFVRNSAMLQCTGTLINDAGSVDAYFLTANHCINTEEAALSVEATWDSYTPCGGTTANEITTNGATLVFSVAGSDNSLLRMHSLPPNRVLLGWSTEPLAEGTTLYRVSHPAGAPTGGAYRQMFGKSAVDPNKQACSSSPRPEFIYSNQTLLGAGPGSSGSAVMIAGGQIVGNLRGPCGGNSFDACDPLNHLVDGSLAAAWPFFGEFLDNGPEPEVCTPSASTLCLAANRFAVSVTWKTGTNTGSGTAVPLTADTGYFWFFGNSNIELMVKVLDARTINGRFWVFYGSLSNVEYTITVRDMQTGATKTYTNPPGNFGSVGDTQAF